MALDNNTQITDRNTINNWFKTGLKPNQQQFWSTWASFWHKSDTLPIGSIKGLGGLLDGKAEENHTHSEYATNDATSLTAENVTAWKKKLGVADLKFDDKAITITQDYADFGLQTGATINAFNNAIYTEVARKLDAPTENATNEYVLMADGSVVAKSEFGKVDKVMGVSPDVNKNVDISGVAMNWTNASQRMSTLPNKSADATFNQFVILDNNGNLGKADNAINALTNTMRVATDAQKDAWRNASLKTNETYSIGQPRVDSLLPPLLLGTNTSITLIGINLFLNTTATTAKVETIDSRNNSVVETITNIAVHQTIPSKLMFNINRDLYVNEVFYYVRVTHNGLTSFLNTNASFILFKDFENLSVDYQWRIRTLRSQVEPKTYNLELKNTSDFIFKNTGKNSEGNYENAVINIVSNKLLESSKTYIIQAIVKYGISNTTNSEKIRFGIIPSNEIPTDESVVTSLLGTGIMGGGYDRNRWIAIPTSGAGRAAQGEYCNLTILIRNGICLVIFKDVAYTLSLPTSMEGTYKLFFNITDSSATYSDIEFMNTNFYQQ